MSAEPEARDGVERDVATHVAGRMAASAAGGLVLAAIVLTLGALTYTQLDALGPARFGALAVFAFAFWRLVADAVRKLREATDARCHLRAGPRGIAIRHPVGSRALGFGYRLLELEIPWDEVNSVRTVRTRHNGFFHHEDILIEHGEEAWVHLEGRMFLEDPHLIIARIMAQRPRT